MNEMTLSKHTARIHAYGVTQIDEALDEYLNLLMTALKLCRVTWVAAYKGDFGQSDSVERQVLDGWIAFDMVNKGAGVSALSKKTQYLSKAFSKGGMDYYTQQALLSSGKMRVHRRDTFHDQLDAENWAAEHHRSIGVFDRMLGVFSFGLFSESYIVADRGVDGPFFDDEDEHHLYRLLNEFSRLHYWLMLERGLIGIDEKPLTPEERVVLKSILCGLNEKEIARKLDKSVSSVHKKIVSIYKKIGVKNKVDLLLKWNIPLDRFIS